MAVSKPPPERQCKGTKGNGERCEKWARRGRDYCVSHGGNVPVGVAHPNFRGGRYSEYMPGVYRERYEEMLSDGEALVLLDELAVARSRLAQLVERVQGSGGPATMRSLRSLWGEMEAANRAGDRDVAGEKLARIGQQIRSAAADYAAWEDLDRWLGRVQRLTESERRRKVEEQEMIALSHHMALISAMVATVRRHVRDAAILRAISGEFGALAQHGRLDSAGAGIGLD